MSTSGDAPPEFDSVERGPGSSDLADSALEVPVLIPANHPSVEALQTEFGAEIVYRHEISAGDQQLVFVKPAENLRVLKWLKSEASQHYDLLVDVSAIDFGGGRPLHLHYQLWSIPHRRALRVKCELPLDALEVESVVSIWQTANWLEREVYDMFGIVFRNHPDPRRILMPESYAEGHPLRKDFPLRGRFSRAEQTRRALSQDPEFYYTPEELAAGGSPLVVEPAGSSASMDGDAPEVGRGEDSPSDMTTKAYDD